MARQQKDARGIQEEVSRLIHALKEVEEDGASVRVPRPTAVERTEPTDPNWTMGRFENARGYERAIARIVAEAQKRFDLKS